LQKFRNVKKIILECDLAKMDGNEVSDWEDIDWQRTNETVNLLLSLGFRISPDSNGLKAMRMGDSLHKKLPSHFVFLREEEKT